MAKLSSAVGNDAFIKGLFYGKSGAGKTVFGTKFPLPIYIADFDGKATSAANYWNAVDPSRLEQIEFTNLLPSGAKGGSDTVKKFMKMLSFWEGLVFKDNALQFEQDKSIGLILSDGSMTTVEDKLSKRIIVPPKNFLLKTIQIDSLTAMADSLMGAIIADNPGLKRTEAITPVMQDWMIFTPHFKNIIYRLLALPCNLVVIAHVKTEKDEATGVISNFIALPGQLPDLMPKLFGEVYYCHLASSGEKGADLKNMALTKSPTDKYVTRTQIQGMPVVIPMEYEYIKSLMSKQTTKKE